MRAAQPMIQTLKASTARQQFSELLNRVYRRETRVLVEKSGIPVAAIVSASDLDRLTQLDEEQAATRAERFQALAATQAAFADVPDEELAQQVAAALTAVRAHQRTQQIPDAPAAQTA